MFKLFVILSVLAIVQAGPPPPFLPPAKPADKCHTICPDVILGLDILVEDVVLKNIALNGQSGCICLNKNRPDKWIVKGEEYGLCDRPVCLKQPKGKDVPKGKGKQCPKNILAKPNETMGQYWTRIYEEQKDAPENGWCPPGHQKWIVFGHLIKKERDTCVCVENFIWMKK